MNSLRYIQKVALHSRRPLPKTAASHSTSFLRLSLAPRVASTRGLATTTNNTSTTPMPEKVKEEGANKTVNHIQKFYGEAHKPLMHRERSYGAPYTDTSKLENLPEDLYLNQLPPNGMGDRIAKGLVEFFKIWTRLFFRDKYAHHAVTLETVAAVPGMIAGMLRHLTSLRRMQRDYGWIPTLLEEAENERMHLLTWMQLTSPSFTERMVVVAAQAFYTPFYALLYILSPRIAHKFVGYLEETACHEYTAFLKAIDDGHIPNGPAPEIAKVYWNLPPDATVRDVVLVVRADEVMHRDVNHEFSHKIRAGIH